MLVGPSTVAEIRAAPQFPALVAEYAGESQIPGMPPPGVDLLAYQALERQGIVSAFAARREDELIGFISVLIPPAMLHYDHVTATVGSWFVTKSARHSGAGWRLLVAAEQAARARGAPVLLLSVPKWAKVDNFLQRAGYVQTSVVYKRDLT